MASQAGHIYPSELRARANAHAVVTVTRVGCHPSTSPSCGIPCGYKYRGLCSKAKATLSRLQCQSPVLSVSHRREGAETGTPLPENPSDDALSNIVGPTLLFAFSVLFLILSKVFFGTDTAADARFFWTL